MSKQGDSSRDARIRELFFEASELTTQEEREDFLKQACADDPHLLEEVASLLSAHEKSNSLMELDLLGEVEDKVNGMIGSTIGRYHVREKLGEGGFGEVFRVEQTEPIQRELALKIIKPGMDSRDVIRRFEGERQALARLDHPNIAHIVDAGATESGRPYFVMELARGEPITQYCDRHGLSIDERLKLFRQVCHGVQHAHQNGIIHRDLNPANIVITKKEGQPVPKIIDFGIAKSLQGHLTGKTVLTQRQFLVGTPEYMSPEQFTRSSSDLDHRADIYSLGSVLYELVSGSPPVNSETMSKAGISEIPRILTEDEPEKPSTRLRTVSDTKGIAEKRGTTLSRLDHKLRGDLDRIIMKCLEKDRIRRYDSMDDLDQDLKAFLECRPVKATAPSISYRIQKLIHRNRQTFLAYTAAAAILVAVLAIVSTFRSGDFISPDFDKNEKSIAVLPLANLSPDPENAFFADGVQEDILTNLSKIKMFELVISRSSTLQYRNPERNLKQIGQELKVRYLVEGSVQRAGNQVRVTVHLIDSLTGDHLWAQNYDRPLNDIFAIQSAVAKEIATALQAVITPEENIQLEYHPTNNQEAYDYWVKFRQLASLRGGVFEEKVALLEQAVAHDPEFAEAWSSMANEYFYMWNYLRESDRKDQILKRACFAYNEGNRLKPENPFSFRARAAQELVQNNDREAAAVHLLKGLSLYPGILELHKTLARVYRDSGRLAESEFHYESVLREDPFSQQVKTELTDVLIYRKMWQEARDRIQVNIRREDFKEYWQMKLIETGYLEHGDLQEFIDALGKLPATPNLQLKQSLLSRDLKSALKLFESGARLRSSTRGLLNGGGAGISRALLLYQTGEKSYWEDYGNQKMESLLASSKHNTRIPFTHFPELAILASMMGKYELMNDAISEARKLTWDKYNTRDFIRRTDVEKWIAMAYLISGDEDKAIEALEAADEISGPFLFNRELEVWFIFDRLRGNPRFDALLE